jgi:hypothetical protein
MNVQWVSSSNGLPREDQSVEFVLDGRDVAIVGTYSSHAFRSRWSGYAIARVSSWRSVAAAEREPARTTVSAELIFA